MAMPRGLGRRFSGPSDRRRADREERGGHQTGAREKRGETDPPLIPLRTPRKQHAAAYHQERGDGEGGDHQAKAAEEHHQPERVGKEGKECMDVGERS
jgi:hypothetical protein